MQAVVREFVSDGVRAAMPHPEAHVVVRFVGDGLDLHAIGAREHVHRKFVRAGLRIAMVRLPLGSAESVLGASAAALAGRVVPLEELWGRDAIELRDRLARAPANAGTLVEQAIAARAAAPRSTLALAAAAEQLAHARVRDVARGFGLSQRQFRRVFRDAVGLSPKSFARLARFHRAVDAARRGASWTRIAAATGYCDQAHLIDEFHAITSTTPRQFMTELTDSLA